MKRTLIWATTFGATGIMLGAMGAHALKSVLTAQQLASFEIGVKYQMYHALFLLALAILSKTTPQLDLKLVKIFTICGIFFFSGSIYLLSLQSVIGVTLTFIGPITPLGGVLLVLAWVTLLLKSMNLARA